MSGVFSIASQAALQNLPVVASQVQTGWAHFFAGFGVMFSSSFGQGNSDSGGIIVVSLSHCCLLKDTLEVREDLQRRLNGSEQDHAKYRIPERKGILTKKVRAAE